jgi:hypothetical protein
VHAGGGEREDCARPFPGHGLYIGGEVELTSIILAMLLEKLVHEWSESGTSDARDVWL